MKTKNTMHYAFGGGLVALTIGLAGCGLGIAEQVDDLIREYNAQVEVLCSCYQALGFATRGECEDHSGYIGPSQRECMTDAYEGDYEASSDYLACVIPLEEQFTDCMSSQLVCGDPTSVQVCVNDYNIGFGSCVQLPGRVQRDLDNCF